MSIASDARTNAAFLRRILWSGPEELTRAQALALRRSAFTFAQEGQGADLRAARSAYLDGMCGQYRFQPPYDDAYLGMHRGCREREFRPDALGDADGSQVQLFVNSHDPVVAGELQLRWRSAFPGAVVRRYVADAHVAPQAEVLGPALD